MTGPGSGKPRRGPWDPAEQVGDVYRAELGPDGKVEQAERLSDPPRIWVGSWLDYNSGILYGRWLDATQDEAALRADVATMLAGSPTTAETGEPAEEWRIFEAENFGTLRIGEQAELSWVSAVARGIRQHGPAFGAWADYVADEAGLSGFEDAYLGHYQSAEAYAEAFAADLGCDQLLERCLPAPLRPYVKIDASRLAADLKLGRDVRVVRADDGGVWIFDAAR